jgi:hypothetical protein
MAASKYIHLRSFTMSRVIYLNYLDVAVVAHLVAGACAFREGLMTRVIFDNIHIVIAQAIAI